MTFDPPFNSTLSQADGESRRPLTTPYSRVRNWSIRAIIVLLTVYEFQSPRIMEEMRLVNVLVLGIGTFFFIVRARLLLKHLQIAPKPPILFFFLYLALVAGSTIWSYSPVDTIQHVLMISIFSFLALTYAGLDSDRFAAELVRVATALAAVSWLMLVVARDIAVLPDIVWRLNGPMAHAQRLALMMSAGLICLTILSVRRSPTISFGARLAFFTIMGVTLFATQTRAFTFFCLIVVSYAFFCHANKMMKTLMLSCLIASIAAAILNWDLVLELIARDGANTMTLTGRTTIWNIAISMIEERPLLGYGFTSFYTPLTQHFFYSEYIAPHAHNSWINAAFETGIVGASLLTMFMLSVLIGGKPRNPGYSESLIIWSILCGTTGLIFGGKMTTPAVLILIFIAQSTWQKYINR